MSNVAQAPQQWLSIITTKTLKQALCIFAVLYLYKDTVHVRSWTVRGLGAMERFIAELAGSHDRAGLEPAGSAPITAQALQQGQIGIYIQTEKMELMELPISLGRS